MRSPPDFDERVIVAEYFLALRAEVVVWADSTHVANA